jgi:hypothetical protein
MQWLFYYALILLCDHAERSEAYRVFSWISNLLSAREMLRSALHDELLKDSFKV